MNDFKREDRYIVIKKSAYPSLEIAQLESYLAENYIWQMDAVVVESDWPEYEKVWEMIEERVNSEHD